MFEEFLPKKKIGVLSPLAVIDNIAYEFYQLVPSGIMMVTVPLGLQEFTAKDVERVFEPIDRQLDLLLERGIDIVQQTGVPLPLLIGPAALQRLLDRIAEKTRLPATSTVLDVVAATLRTCLMVRPKLLRAWPYCGMQRAPEDRLQKSRRAGG
jgi:hypothetical protein